MRYLSLTGLIALAWLCVAGFLFTETLEFPRGLGSGRPSGALFPQLLLLMLAMLSILVLIEIPRKTEQEGLATISPKKFLSRHRLILMYCVLIVLYPYLVIWFGYFLVTPLVVALLSSCLGLKSKVKITIFTVIITLFVYFIFYKFLVVPLPSGLLW